MQLSNNSVSKLNNNSRDSLDIRKKKKKKGK